MLLLQHFICGLPFIRAILMGSKYQTNWPGHVGSGCGPDSTYIPSTRNMLHIVLGAQARCDVAEVQLFGDYLNLYGHSIAARGEQRRAREKRGGDDRGEVR